MSMQYWIDNDDGKVRLIVATDEAVYFETMPAAAADRSVAELVAGKSPATLFGKDATHVPLRTLKRVQHNIHDDDIDFSYREGDKDMSETLQVADAGTRDAVYAAVQTVMTGRFNEYIDTYSRPRAAFGPLVTLSVLGPLTWGLAILAAQIQSQAEVEISGRRQGLKQLFVWTLDTLGPIGVSVIGGLLCLLTVWSLVMRVKQPPLLYILQATPHKPASAIGTGFKYALLLLVWGWVMWRFVI